MTSPWHSSWPCASKLLLTEVIRLLPHNATAAQVAELTPPRFAAARRADAEQFACPTPATKIQALAMGMI
jgi:hypothetical protein